MEIKSESDLDFDTCDKIENMQQSFRTKWRGFSTILTALAAFYLPLVGQSEFENGDRRAILGVSRHFQTTTMTGTMPKAMTMTMSMTITSPKHSKF